VRVYHRTGDEEMAWQALEEGLSNYFSQPGTPAAQAATARARLRTYLELDAMDDRRVFDFDIDGDLEFGEDDLAVSVDLALFDPGGYVGRVVLWDQLPCDRDQALLIAAPSARLLERELGVGRVQGVEVWHVGSRRRHTFDFDDALAALPSVRSVLLRARPIEP
jgi:hypothetical protein